MESSVVREKAEERKLGFCFRQERVKGERKRERSAREPKKKIKWERRTEVIIHTSGWGLSVNFRNFNGCRFFDKRRRFWELLSVELLSFQIRAIV